MADDFSLEEFRVAAERVGLMLTLEEAKEALDGANRWRRNVEQLRGLLRPDLEPAAVFRPPTDEHD